MRTIFLLLLVSCSAQLTAQKNITLLLQQLKNAGPEQVRLERYQEIGTYYGSRHIDSAIYYISEGLKLAEQQKDLKAQGLFLLQMGTINEKHGNSSVAIKLVSRALAVLRKLNDQDAMGKAYAELGLLEGEKSAGSRAANDLNTAFHFFTASLDTAGMVEVFNDLGLIQEKRGDTAGALNYYLKALNQYGKNPPLVPGYFNLLDHIGQLYTLKGNAHEALRYLQQGIKRARGSAALADTEMELLDLEGKAYEKLGDNHKALDLYKQELQDARQHQQLFEQAKALVSIAGVLKSQNTKSSLNDLQEALTIATKIKDKQLAASIYQAMEGVYRQEKNYREALSTLDAHHNLLDSLFGEDKARELAGLDTSYELIESREQIGSLQQSNKTKSLEITIGIIFLVVVLACFVLLYVYFRKIRKLNGELAASNHVKDKVFSVLGHDLRGPIGNAVQLADLLVEHNVDASEQRKLLAMLQQQSSATLDVLESLLKWGKLQLKGIDIHPSVFRPAAVINSNFSLIQVQASEKQLQLISDIDPLLTITADPDHFRVVIRNLLSNAVKFSRNGGSIRVSAGTQGKMVVFSIRDEGVGIASDKLKQFADAGMESSFGTSGEKGVGLGLLLVKEFIQAEGGRIWVESREGEGTTFFFTAIVA